MLQNGNFEIGEVDHAKVAVAADAIDVGLRAILVEIVADDALVEALPTARTELLLCQR